MTHCCFLTDYSAVDDISVINYFIQRKVYCWPFQVGCQNFNGDKSKILHSWYFKTVWQMGVKLTLTLLNNRTMRNACNQWSLIITNSWEGDIPRGGRTRRAIFLGKSPWGGRNNWGAKSLWHRINDMKEYQKVFSKVTKGLKAFLACSDRAAVVWSAKLF